MSLNENINGEEEWLLDFELVEEFPAASDYIWSPRCISPDPTPPSGIPGLDVDDLENDEHSKCLCNPPPNKRARLPPAAASGTKACREKMRRDKLNDRFRELCFILDPEKPPKAADKVEILREAACLLTQLRSEAKKLRESTEEIQLAIKNLKEEKQELRDEKARLRSEKEMMVKLLRGFTTTTTTAPPFFSQPAMLMHTAPAVTDSNKAITQHRGFVPISMWRWVPPAALDTSQDHVLRPPVA